MAFDVKDNDKINGLYYKASIDEVADNTKGDVNMPHLPVPGIYGAVVNTVAQTVARGGKELMKKSAETLNLEEGYKIYLLPK